MTANGQVRDGAVLPKECPVLPRVVVRGAEGYADELHLNPEVMPRLVQLTCRKNGFVFFLFKKGTHTHETYPVTYPETYGDFFE